MSRLRGGWGLDRQRGSLLFVLLTWAAVRILQVRYLGWGTGFDVQLYLQYAQQLGSGAAAYIDFHPEYPPGALPVFLFPLLWGGAADYTHAFALEMMAFDFAACVLMFKSVELRAARWYAPALVALLYIVSTAALFPVLYTRFDLVPGALVLGAVYAHKRRRAGLSALLLGAAGGVKLWPFALVPLWLAAACRRGSLARVLGVALAIGAGAVLVAVPVLPRAGWKVLEFLQYHAARGIQIETTWSTVALLLNMVGLISAHPEHNFGAFHVAGRVPSLFATWSMPLTVLMALVPQVVAIVRRGAQAAHGLQFDAAVVGAVAGFMIAGKVLSPQYMLWLVPVLPLMVRGIPGALVTLGACVLTTVVYPYWSPALEQLEPGHGFAVLAVGSRNVLLAGCYTLAVWRAAGQRQGRT